MEPIIASTPGSPDTPPPQSRGRGAVAPLLAVLCVGLFMVWLDATIVNVALPSLQASLHVGVTDLQWVIDIYTVMFACLLLLAGDIGDLFGRKRVFLIGVLAFTVASAVCASSSDIHMLLAARGLQGAAGSVVMPTSLSIITGTFSSARGRAQAVGIWSGTGSLGLAAGPIVGGLLVEHFGWTSVFWVNVPIGIAAVIVGAMVIPDVRLDRDRRLDLGGALLFTAAIGALTLGLIQANDWGWTSAGVVSTLVLAVVLVAAFVRWERRVAAPIIPTRLFSVPDFAMPNLAGLVTFFGVFGVLLFLSIFLQSFAGMSAIDTGLHFVPMTAAMAVTAPVAGAVTARYGARLPLALGCAVSAVGLMLLTGIQIDSGWSGYLWPLILIGMGTTLAVTPGTIAALATVISARAGMVSGVTQASRQVGGVLGVAVLGAVVIHVFRDRLATALAPLALPPTVHARVVSALTSGGVQGNRLPEPLRTAVVHAAGGALADAIHLAMVIAAAANLVAAVGVLLLMRAPAPQAAGEAAILEPGLETR